MNVTKLPRCDVDHKPINPYPIKHFIIFLIGAFLLNLSRMTIRCDIAHAHRPFSHECVILITLSGVGKNIYAGKITARDVMFDWYQITPARIHRENNLEAGIFPL